MLNQSAAMQGNLRLVLKLQKAQVERMKVKDTELIHRAVLKTHTNYPLQT